MATNEKPLQSTTPIDAEAPSPGIDHLTVVPTNFDPEESGCQHE